MNIENFIIKDLHNRCTIKLEFKNNTLIIVSENGSGKTTILRLLYLFLSKQWAKLIYYEFSSLEATINKRNYVFDKNLYLAQKIDSKAYENIAKKHPTFKSFILNDLPKYDINELKSSQFLLDDIENEYDVPISLLMSILDSINITSFDNSVYNWDTNLIYLPTYRRIEKKFSSLFGDLDKRLFQHLGNIIPEFKNDFLSKKNIDIDLNNIFTDLWDSRDKDKWKREKEDYSYLELTEFGMEDIKINIQKILSKGGAIEKDLMSRLFSFVKVCNKYISNEKEIKILQESRKIVIEVKDSHETIELDDLSSGEKQIISIFYHVLLSEINPILIIDEPELSLSITWQESILKDLGDCEISGLIVATHSPFIVTTELDKFTRGINEFVC